MMRTIPSLLATLTLVTACGLSSSEDTIDTGTAALACFHAAGTVLCADMAHETATPDEVRVDERLRQRVEDFYPSACLDGDADEDRIPDFLELDDPNAEGDETELRCARCNRGPGTQNDFRLRIEGREAELERGKVLADQGDTLLVPTPDGTLAIRLDEGTEHKDGEPSPGSEIRVRGSISDAGEFIADQVEVLCPGPAALPIEDVPPEAEPIEPDPVIVL